MDSETEPKIPAFPPLLDVEISIGPDGKPSWHRAREWSALLPLVENENFKLRFQHSLKARKVKTGLQRSGNVYPDQVYRIIDFNKIRQLGSARFPKGNFEVYREIVSLLLDEKHVFRIIGGSNLSPILAANWTEVRIFKNLMTTSIKYLRANRFSQNDTMIKEIKIRCGHILTQINQLHESIMNFEDEWFDILFDSGTISFNDLGSPAADLMTWKVTSFNAWINNDQSDVKRTYESSLKILLDRFEEANSYMNRINMDINGNAFERLFGEVDIMLMHQAVLFLEKYTQNKTRDKRFKTIQLFCLFKDFCRGSAPKMMNSKIERSEIVDKYMDLYNLCRSWRKLTSLREAEWRDAVTQCLKIPGSEELIKKAGIATRNLEFLFRGPGPAKAARLI